MLLVDPAWRGVGRQVLEGFRTFVSSERGAEDGVDGIEKAESDLPILSNRPQSGLVA